MKFHYIKVHQNGHLYWSVYRQHINLYTQLTQEARYLQDTSYYEYEIQLVYATKWLGKMLEVHSLQ